VNDLAVENGLWHCEVFDCRLKYNTILAPKCHKHGFEGLTHDFLAKKLQSYPYKPRLR
jgi:hypothetical protein